MDGHSWQRRYFTHGLVGLLSMGLGFSLHPGPADGRPVDPIQQVENTWRDRYEKYLKLRFEGQTQASSQVATTLWKRGLVAQQQPAVLYLQPKPEGLTLYLVLPNGVPIQRQVPEANPAALETEVRQLMLAIRDPRQRSQDSYLPAAQTLHRWLIAPIEAELQAAGIRDLIVCPGEGLRTLPFSALHNGQEFLIERYSVTRMPAFSLTNTRYDGVRQGRILAMGASQFRDQTPLPAVPVELKTIAGQLWPGRVFLNRDFTIANLTQQRLRQPYEIVHLATHADFNKGAPQDSYIQFWNQRLTLDQLGQIPWQNPPLELLVLSACNTAVGDKNAELGFAGMAAQAGVKTVLASLWYVSDEGTLALMTEFYRDLKATPVKAEALRRAQLALLRGEVQLTDGQLVRAGRRGGIPLPPELTNVGDRSLAHPYYWAAFTLIGSPW